MPHIMHLKLSPIALLLAFFTFSSIAAESLPSVRIGAILILTGEGSSWGVASKNGMELAVKDINKAGGILGRPLEVSYQDDRGDPKQTISAFKQLTEVDNIDFIIGPTWSNQGLALVKLADRTQTILISPTLGVAEFNESSEYLFTTWPHDYLLSEKLAEHVYAKGFRSVALVGAEQVWVKEQTQAFKGKFETLGGKIAYITEPLPSTTDVRSDALKIIKTPSIDALVSTTDGIIIGSLIAKVLKESNFSIPMFSITLDQAAIDAAQGGFEGLEFLTCLTPTKDFQKRYETHYKTNIDIGADSAYDAVMLLKNAIESTGSLEPKLVADALARINKLEGVSGTLISDGKRGVIKACRAKKVIDGKPNDL
jgi:ABC-type branched-subunit amino acid transport system substrate-binding protein